MAEIIKFPGRGNGGTYQDGTGEASLVTATVIEEKEEKITVDIPASRSRAFFKQMRKAALRPFYQSDILLTLQDDAMSLDIDPDLWDNPELRKKRLAEIAARCMILWDHIP